MRLDRSLREATSCHYPEGYTAPPTGMMNTQSASFQVGAGQSGGEVVGEHGGLLPAFLRLKGKLVPIPLEKEDVIVQFVEDSKVFSGCPIYQMTAPQITKARCKALQIKYLGVGGYQMSSGSELIPFTGEKFVGYRFNSKILYEKKFCFQNTGTLTCTKTSLGNNRYLVTPPNMELGYPLWGYGGFYDPRCRVSQIEQMFFTITQDKGKSAIHLVALSLLREKGVSPLTGGKLGQEIVVYMDKISEDQSLSLRDSLEGGASKIELIYGIDENGKDLTYPYHSFQVFEGDGGIDEIEITFKRY